MHVAGEVSVTLNIPLPVVSAHPDQKEAERRTEAARRYLKRYGADARTVASTKHAEEAILSIEKEDDHGLIVMGAYGHSRILELVLGSTTEHVMRQTESAVLLHR
tara:strand:- start:294 stop:608 length:315 start_codon:yes stop_codon:yes gene_type:complete